MADDSMVGGHQRVSHQDGHHVNESYKVPSPTGRDNLSYMHPHLKPMPIEAAFKAVDKTLAEANRPSGQMSHSKTVFPVNQGKTRGAPPQPSWAKATRAPSHSPSPGIIPGPVKPPTF